MKKGEEVHEEAHKEVHSSDDNSHEGAFPIWLVVLRPRYARPNREEVLSRSRHSSLQPYEYMQTSRVGLDSLPRFTSKLSSGFLPHLFSSNLS